MCKNTRSICAFRIKKHKAGQLKLGITIYPCKHNIIPTESLGKTTQYLLTVTLLCLLSCSSAATEISCGDSPKPLNTAAEFLGSFPKRKMFGRLIYSYFYHSCFILLQSGVLNKNKD